MKFISLIILSLFFSLNNFCASSKTENEAVMHNKAFKAGENLIYSVYYKVGFNVEVATVTFAINEEKRNGRDNYHLNVVGRVRPSFRWFFDLYDVYDVWIDKNSMHPTYFENSLSEGSYRFKSSYTYNWDEMVVNTWAHNPKYDAQFKTFQLTKDSFDALSLLYKLRTVNISNIEIDKPYRLNVVFEDRVRDVFYRYTGSEVKNVKGFGDFKVLVFVCSLATDDGKPYEDGGEFTIMFSDDKNRIPVYVQSPIKVGSVRVCLSSVEGLMHPMSSLVKRSKNSNAPK